MKAGMVMLTIRQTSSAWAAVVALILVSAPAHAQQKIRLGLLPISEVLGAVIADREGYFKAEGLDVEISKFESGAAAVSVLQAGRVDIAFANPVSAMQAIEQGLNAVVLAPGAVIRSAPPDTTTALLALKDNVKSIKDLEGKRVAVNVINSSVWLHVAATLDQRGVDWRKVRFTEIPFPQMNDPLLNGQVDAVTQVDPFRSVMMATGKVEILAWTYVEAAPGTDVSQYITLAPWAEKNHDTAVKFVRAVLKGVQFASTNEAATRDINQAWTGLNPAFKDKVLLPQLGTAVNVAGMAQTMQLMQKFGLLKAPIDISKRVFVMP
jgi:NitT/TauT family transport system substrate-binding protein